MPWAYTVDAEVWRMVEGGEVVGGERGVMGGEKGVIGWEQDGREREWGRAKKGQRESAYNA